MRKLKELLQVEVAQATRETLATNKSLCESRQDWSVEEVVAGLYAERYCHLCGCRYDRLVPAGTRADTGVSAEPYQSTRKVRSPQDTGPSRPAGSVAISASARPENATWRVAHCPRNSWLGGRCVAQRTGPNNDWSGHLGPFASEAQRSCGHLSSSTTVRCENQRPEGRVFSLHASQFLEKEFQ